MRQTKQNCFSLTMYTQGKKAVCRLETNHEIIILDCGELLGDILDLVVCVDKDTLLIDDTNYIYSDIGQRDAIREIINAMNPLNAEKYRIFITVGLLLDMYGIKLNKTIFRYSIAAAQIHPAYADYIVVTKGNDAHKIIDPAAFYVAFYNFQKFKRENNLMIEMQCHSLGDVALGLLQFILENGFHIARCANCGRYFIAYNRSDTRYCDRQAPQDAKKSCKEYGAYKQHQKNIKENKVLALERKIYHRLLMQAKRNPDIEHLKKRYEKFKVELKKQKREIRIGNKTELEFFEWLKEQNK